MVKLTPWRMDVGAGLGLLIGAFFWWDDYRSGADLFENPQLLIVPAALGLWIVNFRNKRKKVGPYDLETIAKNKAGRV